MAAVLRVKRRNSEEPLTALVIKCKRRKVDEDSEEKEEVDSAPLTTVLKFAGTVKNQEDSVVEHLVKSLGKEELKSNYKQHAVDVLRKSRETAKKASTENRYKVVNCFRSSDTSNVEEFEDKVMTVIDVEDSVSCSVTEDAAPAKDDIYVYDLYYAQTEDNMHIDNRVSIHTLDQELVFDTYRNNGGHSENECESEDSNSESNWRNDYPDSDHSEHSQRSINEDDMRGAIMSMRLESGSDLSSEEEFVYAVDEQDVDHYGYKYAKYKARIKAEMGDEDSDDSDASEYSGVYISEVSDDSDLQHVND